MTPSGFLLDTHALLWALTAPDQLGPHARSVIEDPATSLLVSAASAWELSTKHRLGRLPQADPILATYARHLARLDVREVPITSEHALLAGHLDWEHRDPFDRMLAAQCVAESLTLITRDAAFGGLSTVRTLW